MLAVLAAICAAACWSARPLQRRRPPDVAPGALALAMRRPPVRRVRQRSPDARGRDEDRPRKPRGAAISDENRKILDRIRGWQCGDEEVREVIAELIQERRLNSTREYTAFINELGNRRLWEEGLALLAGREQGPAKVNVQVCNAVLASCAKAQQWERLVGLLADMWEKEVTPDMVSYNIIMGACDGLRKWRTVLSLLDDMQRCRRRDFFTFNFSISACVQGRQWERALDLMDEMLYWDVTPDWRMYNLGVILAGEGGQWKIALEFVDDMWRREVLPDFVTYSAAVQVCEKTRRWQEALRLLRDMRRKGFAPDGPTYEAAAGACRSCGQEAQAQDLEQERRLLAGRRDSQAVAVPRPLLAPLA